jgi:hypothetical protein
MMDHDVLNDILYEAARNPEFRRRLLTEPYAVLSSYNIDERLRDMVVRIIEDSRGIQQ